MHRPGGQSVMTLTLSGPSLRTRWRPLMANARAELAACASQDWRSTSVLHRVVLASPGLSSTRAHDNAAAWVGVGRRTCDPLTIARSHASTGDGAGVQGAGVRGGPGSHDAEQTTTTVRWVREGRRPEPVRDVRTHRRARPRRSSRLGW
jgi:hypothetical protein